MLLSRPRARDAQKLSGCGLKRWNAITFLESFSKSFQLKKTAFGAELLLPYLQLLFILFCYPSHRKLRFFFISFCFRLLSIKTRLERVIYHNINCLSFFSFNSSFFTGFSSWTWVSRYKWVGSLICVSVLSLISASISV